MLFYVKVLSVRDEPNMFKNLPTILSGTSQFLPLCIILPALLLLSSPTYYSLILF